MSAREVDLFDLLKAKAREVVPRGGKAYLYGSRARGDYRSDSDWDILILVDKPTAEMADYDDLSYPLTKLGWEHDASVIPVVYGQDEWNHVSSLLFRKNVEQDAIQLV